MAAEKKMRALISNMNRIMRDTRLYPKGRILAALLHAAFSPTTSDEDRRFIKALIVAQFIRKGGIDFSDESGLSLPGYGKAPNTKIEAEAADHIDEFLETMLRGGNGESGTAKGTNSDSNSASSAS